MARVAVVSDSTADLSEAQIKQYDLTVVPLTVDLDCKTYSDGVDLSAAEFYEKLPLSKEIPRTSQPSPQSFVDVYNVLLRNHDSVLSIHISSQLSGTLNSARIASGMVDGNVVTVDTKTASQGIARSVLIAAEAIGRGWSLEETLAIVRKSIDQTFSIFAVDTLEYLHRNGRIGRAASYLGSALSLKPILYADPEGMVAPFGKVLGRRNVIPKLVEIVQSRISPDTEVNVSVVHSGAADAASTLLEELNRTYRVVDHMMGMVGPAIGANVGPGALGIMIQPSFENLALGLERVFDHGR